MNRFIYCTSRFVKFRKRVNMNNLNDINNTKNMSNLKRLTWKITGKSGEEHKIALNRGVNIRDPMSLVMDGQVIATLQIPATSTIAKLEEPVTLILFAKKADLVYNGVFQGSKRKYSANTKIGWWFLVLMALLNFASPVVFLGKPISWVMAVSCSGLTWIMMISPFQSKIRKVLFSFMFLLWCWGISLLGWYWLV